MRIATLVILLAIFISCKKNTVTQPPVVTPIDTVVTPIDTMQVMFGNYYGMYLSGTYSYDLDTFTDCTMSVVRDGDTITSTITCPQLSAPDIKKNYIYQVYVDSQRIYFSCNGFSRIHHYYYYFATDSIQFTDSRFWSSDQGYYQFRGLQQ